MDQLSEARRHIVLRYLWIDRRDLCANETEREYYDALTQSLAESRVNLARVTSRWTPVRRKRRFESSNLPPAAA